MIGKLESSNMGTATFTATDGAVIRLNTIERTDEQGEYYAYDESGKKWLLEDREDEAELTEVDW